jgi:hypothetical protein
VLSFQGGFQPPGLLQSVQENNKEVIVRALLQMAAGKRAHFGNLKLLGRPAEDGKSAGRDSDEGG